MLFWVSYLNRSLSCEHIEEKICFFHFVLMWLMTFRRLLLDENWRETGGANESQVLESCVKAGSELL